MFEVTKNNVKILLSSPFRVADYVYENSHNWDMSYWFINKCKNMRVGEFDIVIEEFTVDGVAIKIKRVS